MQNLQELIKNLSKAEKKLVRKYLSTFSSKGVSNTVNLQLFDVLNKSKKTLSKKECSMLLFKKFEDRRLRVIKSRLKQKILDALFTDMVLETQRYDNNTKQSILLKKKLAQFQLLLFTNKTNNKELVKILDNIIKNSEKNEQFNILIESLRYKKLIVGFRASLETFNMFDKKIDKAIKRGESKDQIVNSYYKMILLYRTTNPNHNYIKKQLESFIKESEALLKQGYTIIGDYYLNIIRAGYFMEVKEHIKAIDVMKKQLAHLNNNKVIYRKSRIGATYDYLCENYMMLGDYNNAYKNNEKAIEFFTPKSINYIVAQQLAFRAKLYDEKLEEAKKLINKISNQYKDSIDKHRTSIHKFFLANLYFAQKDYKNCNRLLSQKYEFKQDRTGWEFNHKLLHMMCLIEQDKIEDAHTMFINFNRLLKKYQKSEVSNRNKVIIAILKVWFKQGGNKKLLQLKNSSLINQLSAPENLWNPMKSELIRFDKWITTKI